MKIEYIKGDLFQSDVGVLVHGCNAQGVMGSGVAKIVREKYPKAYKDYLSFCQDGVELGDVIYSLCDDKIICNAITQEFYGRDGKRYVSYDAVDDCMEEIESKNFARVAMPMIGAGLGGGSWDVIEKIIEDRLKTTQVFVYIL